MRKKIKQKRVKIKPPNFLRGLRRLAFYKRDFPKYVVKTNRSEIVFEMLGETTEFRVRTFFSKEPETLTWINNFKKKDTFWDIGANIGLFSIYAAKEKNLNVYAFEPAPANFYLLSKNKILNKLKKTLTVVPIALFCKKALVNWFPDISFASANNQIKNTQKGSMIQTYRIDDLSKNSLLKFPNYLKIDVDGVEYQILEGAKKTLKDKRCKSVLIELNESNKKVLEKILNLLKEAGFKTFVNRHPPYYDKNYYLPFANYIFYKQ